MTEEDCDMDTQENIEQCKKSWEMEEMEKMWRLKATAFPTLSPIPGSSKSHGKQMATPKHLNTDTHTHTHTHKHTHTHTHPYKHTHTHTHTHTHP